METLACGPLILIPLSFGYSIVRYRLMDVDVIMRRSFVHVMAIVAVAAIYMAVLLGVGDLVKFIWATADLNSWRTRVVVVIGMLIVTMLFAPDQEQASGLGRSVVLRREVYAEDRASGFRQNALANDRASATARFARAATVGHALGSQGRYLYRRRERHLRVPAGPRFGH